MSSGLRTLIVGIDAACEEILDPLFDDDLPTLGRIFRAGANGRLRSQIPPWTASAWPSLYTGTNPGKHGVFDFLAFAGYDWSVINATTVRMPPLWDLLDVHGLTSVVVNVPVTYPPAPFDGALVPGYVAPEDPTGHPEGVLDEIREETGPYRVYPEHTGENRPDRAAIVAEHVELAAMRGRAFRYLADRFDPDMGFVQFQGTDSVVHELPGDREAIRDVYRAVDRAVASVIRAFDPDTVIVVSDHGIGPYDGYEVRINEVLRRADLLETVRGGRGMPTWAGIRDRNLTEGETADDTPAGAVARVARTLARHGITSQRIARVLTPLGLEETVARIAPTDAIRAGTEQVDFPNSVAYVRSRVECGVRLNVRGREPDGVVPPEDYESVRREVIDLLRDLESPAGNAIFETVAPREEFFEGATVDDAVDIVTVPADFDHMLSAQVREDVFGEPREPWNHKRHGVIAVHGDVVDGPRSIEEAQIFDVAPTVLATLDVPVGDHMDGEPLSIVDPPGIRSYSTERRSRVETERTETVEARLNDLGYLE